MDPVTPSETAAPVSGSNRVAPAMLSRTVRFCINPDGSRKGPNGHAGRPAMRGLGRYYEITATVSGEPDPQTGYIISIHDIDVPIRESVLPLIDRACLYSPSREPAALLQELWDQAEQAVPRPLERLIWNLTPTYKVEMSVTDRQANRVLIRQKFDFAAAHRLHTPELSDEENRRIFGKCNNPGGHGHNYQIEPTVAIPGEHADGFALANLEAIVKSAVIEPFDHKHLNTDTTDFDQSRGGVIPSVERIAMVCYQRLAGPIRDLVEGAELVRVTVWETDRTSCTFPA